MILNIKTRLYPGFAVAINRIFVVSASHIKIKVADNLPVGYTNKAELQQVFQNLISNAIKYMDKAEGSIAIDAIENDSYFTFSVRDNGPGIAKQDDVRIFKLFEVTDNKTNYDSSTYWP